MMKRLAILVAPFRGRSAEDVEEIDEAKIILLEAGLLPMFLPDTLAAVLDDDVDEQRSMAVGASAFWCKTMAKIPHAQVVVVGNRMTQGMRSDVAAWLDAGGPAPMNISDLCTDRE